MTTYTVTLRFQFPAYNEKNGIVLGEFRATSKSKAISYAKVIAERDGHWPNNVGQGRASFKAVEA